MAILQDPASAGTERGARAGSARRQRATFAFLFGAVMVEMIFFIVLGPLLPYYASKLGLSRLGAGVLSASYAVGVGLTAVPAGVLVARIGGRRPAIGGLLLVGVACAAFALGGSAIELDAARTLQGVGGALLWAGAMAWLIELGGTSNRGRMIGLAFSAAAAGACVGPALGALATLAGPRPVFLALAALIVGLGAMGAAVAGRPPDAPPPRTPVRLRAALAAAPTRRALAVVALPSIGIGVAGVLVPLRLHALGATTAAIAGAYLVASLLETLVNPLVGRWYDKRGAARVLRATLSASSVCVVVLALGLPEAGLLVALAVAWPVIGSVWVPALGELTAALERAGGESAGLAFGLFSLCWAASQALGALAGAQLAGAAESAPYLILAVLYVAAARKPTA